MAFDVGEFKAHLVGGGARPTLFQVTIPGPSRIPGITKGAEELTFMCKSSQLPGQDIGVIQVPYFGRKLPLAGDAVFAEWSITVINDENFAVRDMFESWMNAINNHVANLRSDSIGSKPGNYMCDMSIVQFSKDGKRIKQYNLINAWPSSLPAIDVGWETNDAIEEFPVTIQYSWWEARTTDQTTTIDDERVV